MICEQISRPTSGEFDEIHFDYESVWKQELWTWIKFTDDDYTEWCASFRGNFQGLGLNPDTNQAIILTSGAFYKIDCQSKVLLQIKENIQINQLTISPDFQKFIIGYYYNIFIMDWDFNHEAISAPIKLDMVNFKNWEGNTLYFTCDEFLNWDRHLLCKLNYPALTIEIVEEM